LIRTLEGITPKVADTAWVSEFAYVVGNVEIGEFASIWPGVTIRGDSPDTIIIGDYVNIQEGSVIQGNNCTILNRVVLGENCLVAANSVVLGGTQVPDRSFVTGAPASVKREVTDKQVAQMAHTNEELVKRAKSFKDSGL
jgi:carbonic anhydrase/acetyltransferase-like protein (isoleucine patch superfamily)